MDPRVADLDGRSVQGERGQAKRAGWPVDPTRLRRALLSGRRWLIGAAVLGLSVGLVLAKLVLGNSWESMAVLHYEGDLLVAGPDGPTWYRSSYALTPAAETLHHEAFLHRVQQETGSDMDLIGLELAIAYEVDDNAGILRISGIADDAESAAEFTHDVTDIFLDYRRDRQARRIEEEIRRIDVRVRGAEEEAKIARQRFEDFLDTHGIANLNAEQASTVRSAAQLRADTQLAALEIPALEAQVKTLESQLESMPKTSVTPGTNPEQAALSRLRQELASTRATLSEDHPRVQALQHQVDQLSAQLRTGSRGSGLIASNAAYVSVEAQLRQAESSLASLRERHKGLSELASKAKGRIDAFSGVEGEASALLAEVEVQEALIRRLQRTEAALEDVLEDPTSGFTILERGPVPEFPIANPVKIVAFAGMSVVSVLLALGLVLSREFKGLYVLTPAETAFWGDGPVLGATPWPADPLGLDELVAGLDDVAPESVGTVLIVPGAAEDARYAHQLARRMSQDWFLDGPSGSPQTTHVSAPSQQVPLTTPPPQPSGPYPVGGSRAPSVAAAQPSTALALRSVKLVHQPQELRMTAWDGPFEGLALRRAARLADRVIVLVRSGAMTWPTMHAIKRRLGRDRGIGYVVLALPDEFHMLPDRVGNVSSFWER